MTVPTSLHGTYQGMRTYVEAMDGDQHFIGSGIEEVFGIDYDDLACKNCHSMLAFNEPDENTCDNCHKYMSIKNINCLECHGKQAMEIVNGLPDVHRRNSDTFDCMDCHSLSEVHGDMRGVEKPYVSLREDGAMDTKCQNCHDEDALSAGNHAIHKDTLDCSACHVESVLTCYNCHMETYMETGNDLLSMNSQVKNWLFLVNDENGKVRAGNFQSLTYADKTFVVFAPYFAHAVTDEPRTCSECHGNEAMNELDAMGKITVTTWDETAQELTAREGVIPVIDGKLEFEFLNYDDETQTWTSMGTGTDNIQYGFCTPLTDEQVGKLKAGFHTSE